MQITGLPIQRTEKIQVKSPRISDYSKVVGYMVNIQKLITSQYTSSEQDEFEIKNTLSLILASKKNEMPQHKYNKICTRSI